MLATRRRVRTVGVALVASMALVPALAWPAEASHGKKFDPKTIRAIDAIVSATKNGSGTPGVMVGIWDPKRGNFVKGYGTKDLADPQLPPFTAKDRVRIASVTKSFTATAVLQLVASKKLSLGAHLSEFVPDIENGDSITVAQLLNMTAGVYSYTDDQTFLASYFADPAFPFTTDDALGIVRAHSANFAPGTNTRYSDSNYVLAGLIVEKVTGRPLGEVIQRQILDKADLDGSSYPTANTMPVPFSHGYLAQPLGAPRDVTEGNPGVAGGAGAMISDLDDLHEWAVALGTGTLLPKNLQRLRLKTTRPLIDTPKLKVAYGMGVTNLNGFIGHDGGILGYATAMFYLPEEKATIVVESNSDNVSAQSALWTFIGIASYLYPDQFPNGL